MFLVQLLKESNEHTVKAMIRNENQKEYFDSIGIKTVLADLEGTVDQIAEAIKGAEGIVFTAGSDGHTGADKTLLVDLDGAVKTIEAAEKTGVQRFIMVSALQPIIDKIGTKKLNIIMLPNIMLTVSLSKAV